ncbi:MAG TPA: hypothetical protein VLS92_03670 [Acidimicrobiia bacterium]|nr:hypothetical protein [Acidimicrobiia bacterium]
MNVVWRLLSVGALLVSAGVLLFSIIAVRREQRVRPGLDLLRLTITIVTTVLMAVVVGVTTPEALMGAGLLVGLLVGLYEGLHVRVRFLGKSTFARRTVLGVAAWGVGVLAVQTAGVIGRVGLADFGLTMSFFGIGQVAGLLTGRWQSVLEARRAAVGRLAGVALVALAATSALLPGWGPSAPAAGAQSEDLSTGDVQATLRWSSPADLDLSVTDPAGDTVSFTNRTVASGGQLDVDANYPCSTATASPVENVFWPPGGAPRGSYRVTVTYRTGCGTEPAQSYELTVLFGGEVVRQVNATIEPGEEVAIDLAYAGGGRPPGDEVLSAGEGTGAAAVGLAGSALLLLTDLAGGGHSFASLAGAWKGGGLRRLRDQVAGTPRGGDGVAAGRDPSLELSRGRAAGALDALPPDLRDAAREVVWARLDDEETDRLAAVVRRAMGPWDEAADPAQALAADERAVGLLTQIPEDVRRRVEERAAAGLREERLGRWVEKLRGLAAPPRAGGSVLDGPEAQHLLAGLPPGLRGQVESQASEALEGEMVQRLVGEARRALERDRAGELLRAALAQEDGDRADAVVRVLGTSPGPAGEADLEDLVRRATGRGRADLAALPRRGVAGPPVDLTEHLAGEPDLLAAARRVESVEQVLGGAGPGLSPQVEEALVQNLNADRVGRAVREAAEVLEREGRAVADVMSAVDDLPAAKRAFDGLARAARDEACRLLGRRLRARRLEGAVEKVGRAVALDRAEESLRQAAGVGDIDGAERILAGLSPEDAQSVSTAAFADG